jgi:CRP-like cAMP-binding protein
VQLNCACGADTYPANRSLPTLTYVSAQFSCLCHKFNFKSLFCIASDGPDWDCRPRCKVEAVLIKLLAQKLGQISPISLAEYKALEGCIQHVRELEAREDFAAEAGPAKGVNLMVDGFACRYKVLPDGRRQIVSYFLPGDTCDRRVYAQPVLDHSIGTLAPSIIAHFSHAALAVVLNQYPNIAAAMSWAELVEEATSREWILNVGQRTAYERISHVLCEVYHRLKAVSLAVDGQCAFPVTQNDLADTTGLSSVHVNRVLQELRQAGLIELRDKRLRIYDLPALEAAGLFDLTYLTLRLPGTDSRMSVVDMP